MSVSNSDTNIGNFGVVGRQLILQERASERGYMLAQLQVFPQLHALLSFIGQFLPVSLQFGLSAAKETAQTAATIIENRIFEQCFIVSKLVRTASGR